MSFLGSPSLSPATLLVLSESEKGRGMSSHQFSQAFSPPAILRDAQVLELGAGTEKRKLEPGGQPRVLGLEALWKRAAGGSSSGKPVGSEQAGLCLAWRRRSYPSRCRSCHRARCPVQSSHQVSATRQQRGWSWPPWSGASVQWHQRPWGGCARLVLTQPRSHRAQAEVPEELPRTYISNLQQDKVSFRLAHTTLFQRTLCRGNKKADMMSTGPVTTKTEN